MRLCSIVIVYIELIFDVGKTFVRERRKMPRFLALAFFSFSALIDSASAARYNSTFLCSSYRLTSAYLCLSRLYLAACSLAYSFSSMRRSSASLSYSILRAFCFR